MIGRYRKKPVVIEAVQFTPGVNESDIVAWAGEHGQVVNSGLLAGAPTLRIQTLEGTMEASGGDWIIRGVQGEFYPCKPVIFGATYEAVAE